MGLFTKDPERVLREEQDEQNLVKKFRAMPEHQLIMAMLLEIDSAATQVISGPLLDEAIKRSGHDPYK